MTLMCVFLSSPLCKQNQGVRIFTLSTLSIFLSSPFSSKDYPMHTLRCSPILFFYYATLCPHCQCSTKTVTAIQIQRCLLLSGMQTDANLSAHRTSQIILDLKHIHTEIYWANSFTHYMMTGEPSKSALAYSSVKKFASSFFLY